jgi:hypothetical protein
MEPTQELYADRRPIDNRSTSAAALAASNQIPLMWTGHSFPSVAGVLDHLPPREREAARGGPVRTHGGDRRRRMPGAAVAPEHAVPMQRGSR